jgi:hypothetical protein
LDNWLLRFQAKYGLPHYTLHSLRHTNIALQIAAGVPIVTVSKRAGHARTSTTTDIYAYSLEASDNDAANKIEDIFSGKISIKIGTINEQKENTSFENDVEEFKRIKEEMNKLGFDSLKEYQEYLEFKKMKQMGA